MRRLMCGMPRSMTETLAERFTDALDRIGLQNTWYDFAPGMLGQDATLDMAARAIVVFDGAGSKQLVTSHKCSSDVAYQYALESVQRSLEASEVSLMTVGLLGLYELLRKDHTAAVRTHSHGITAIVSTLLGAGQPATPVVRAAFHSNTYTSFQEPVVLGKASPFEHEEWLELDPAAVMPLPTSAWRLVKIGQQVTLRLPRLIAQVREIRQGTVLASSAFRRVFESANKLLALKDDATEEELLRTVTLLSSEPAVELLDPPPRTSSFSFKSSQDRDAILLYWATRLMVLKLCLVLSQIGTSDREEEVFRLRHTIPQLEHEQGSLVMCLLMCWRNGFGSLSVFTILWGALMGREQVREHSAQSIRDWLIRKQREEMATWELDYDCAHADADADVFAGGPFDGPQVGILRGLAQELGEDVEFSKGLRKQSESNASIAST